jgi:hypothetical protein
LLQRVLQCDASTAWNALVVAMAVWNRQFEFALAASASFASRGDFRARPEEQEDPTAPGYDLAARSGAFAPSGRQDVHPSLRLLARVIFRPQRQKGKGDKVVLSDLAVYRKPFREWPMPTCSQLQPRTAPVTAKERAKQREYNLEHLEALARHEALSRVEEVAKEGFDEYRDRVPT